MNQLKLGEIYTLVKEIRQKAKDCCQTLYSNMYQFYNRETEELLCDYRIAHSSLLFSYCDQNEIHRLYFLSFDLQELSKELVYFPKGYILDYICKGANLLDSYFCDGGFKKIASYVRKSTNLRADGNDFKRSHSDILDKYYDENVGEYAEEKDAEEIAALLNQVFNREADRIPSVDDLRDYIRNHWVLIYRLSGKIRCLYIYQIQGRRFYSNFSYNSLPAIVLYCLEKRAHTDVIRNYDVRIKYSWINTENTRSLRRNVLQYDDMYIYVYKKE